MAPLSEAQQEKRLSGIGSSEIAAVLGENPFKNAHHVWLVKRGLIEDEGETGKTWLGHVIEPALAEWYGQETGRRVRRFGRTVRHRVHDFALASPDYEVIDAAERHLVECKVVGWRVEHHWDIHVPEGIPLYVLLQCQWQMGCTGAKRCDVVVLFLDDCERRIYELTFDADLFAKMVAAASDFWRRVLAGEAPPIDGSEEARLVLESIYQWKRAALKPAPPEAEELFARHMAASRVIKDAEAEKDLATNKLCELVGDADGIVGELAKFTWKKRVDGVRVARLTPVKVTKEKAA